MGQQGISDFKYPQLVSLSRYNDVSNIPYDPEFENEFNPAFERSNELRKVNNANIDQQRLQALNRTPPPKKPYELPFSDILINIKDAWFGLIDDLLQQHFYMETFTKNN